MDQKTGERRFKTSHLIFSSLKILGNIFYFLGAVGLAICILAFIVSTLEVVKFQYLVYAMVCLMVVIIGLVAVVIAESALIVIEIENNTRILVEILTELLQDIQKVMNKLG